VFASNKEEFTVLNLEEKLRLIKDYLRVSKLQPVPESVTHACFQRKQVKSGLERIARRQVKNGKRLNYEIALKMLKEKGAQTTKLPYIFINTSSSGKHRLRLFIKKISNNSEQSSSYTTYGLSKNGSTVPIF